MLMPQGWRVGMPKGQGGGMAQGGGYSPNPGVGDMMGGGAAGGGASVGALMGDPAAEAKAEKAALAELHKQGIVLQCVNDQNGTLGEAPTRYYLQVYKDCGGIEGAKAMVKDEMVNEGVGKAFPMPGGQAWEYENKGQNKIGDVERHVTYIFGDGPDAYVLRFVSTNNPTIFDPFHAEVAKSVRKAGAKKA